MTKFFVPPGPGRPPRVDRREDDELWWNRAREAVEASGIECTASRIFRLGYVSGETELVAEVGQPAVIDGRQLVVGAIFETEDSYVIRAMFDATTQVPKGDVNERVEFDAP